MVLPIALLSVGTLNTVQLRHSDAKAYHENKCPAPIPRAARLQLTGQSSPAA